MKARTRLNGLVAILAASASLSPLGQWGIAQSAPEVTFAIGDRCDAIDSLSFETLRELTTLEDDSVRRHFCSVVSRADCVDRRGAIQDFGALLPSESIGFCRFVPREVGSGETTQVVEQFGERNPGTGG